MWPGKVASKLLYKTSAVSLFAGLSDAHCTSGSQHHRHDHSRAPTLVLRFFTSGFEEKRDGSQSVVKHSICNLLNLLRKTRVLWISFHRVDMQSKGGSRKFRKGGGRVPHPPPFPQMKTSLFRTCGIQHFGRIYDAK